MPSLRSPAARHRTAVRMHLVARDWEIVQPRTEAEEPAARPVPQVKMQQTLAEYFASRKK